MKNRVKVSTSNNYWKTYFRYTMYQYSDGRIRIIRDCDKKLIFECNFKEELNEVMIQQLWIWGIANLDENKD